MIRKTGGCLCGAVRIAATLTGDAIQLCHCGQCQRWTGGGPLVSVRVDDLEVEGDAAIATYKASDWGERAFCGTCGSTLYWRMAGKPVKYIAAGLLDDQGDLTVRSEIFIDDRPAWLPAWPDAAQRTEAEELAALHAYLEGQPT